MGGATGLTTLEYAVARVGTTGHNCHRGGSYRGDERDATTTSSAGEEGVVGTATGLYAMDAAFGGVCTIHIGEQREDRVPGRYVPSRAGVGAPGCIIAPRVGNLWLSGHDRERVDTGGDDGGDCTGAT